MLAFISNLPGVDVM